MNYGLDAKEGARLAEREKYGDWYRDPWGWPEFHWIQQNPSKLPWNDLIAKSSGGIELRAAPFFHLIEVPKARLGVRPAVVQDPPSRILYLAAIHSKIGAVHSTLPDWVFGWRARNGTKLGDNRQEWPNYLQRLASTEPTESGLQTDIASFFASIPPSHICSLVLEKFGKTAPASVITQVITEHDSLTTRSGLPQRSFASAALAHLYLAPLDDVILGALGSSRIRAAARWMDDINAIGQESSLYKLFIRLQERAQELGLDLNSSKSRLASASEIVQSIQLTDVAHLNELIHDTPGYLPVAPKLNLSFVHALEDAILDRRIHHSTAIRATLKALRNSGQFDRLCDWLSIAYAIPHHADSLGRYARDGSIQLDTEDPFGPHWERLTEWFADFERDGWATLDWVAAQLSLMFPTRSRAHSSSSSNSSSIFYAWLESSPNIQKVAVATHWVSTTDPASCRDIIRPRIDRTDDPLLLRLFALGLLVSGANRREIEPILNKDRRNILLLKTLEDRSWQPPRSTDDFDPESST